MFNLFVFIFINYKSNILNYFSTYLKGPIQIIFETRDKINKNFALKVVIVKCNSEQSWEVTKNLSITNLENEIKYLQNIEIWELDLIDNMETFAVQVPNNICNGIVVFLLNHDINKKNKIIIPNLSSYEALKIIIDSENVEPQITDSVREVIFLSKEKNN